MSHPADLGNLKSAEWDQLQELADRFEKACVDAGPKLDLVDLASFLPPEVDPLRMVSLHELIKTDLEIRWRRGQTIPLERYLDRFPELGTAAALPRELIYEEYCVRQRHGDKPDLASYQARFPEQFAALQRLAHEQPIQTVATISPKATVTTPPPSPPPPTTNPSASTAGELLPFGGGYKKIKRIGAGSFGEVWRAEAPGGIAVAIKVINRPIDHEEAQRELQALERIKNLSHPFLLQTQAVFLFEDRLYIVMELADGSLRDRLKQCRGNDPPGIPVQELMQYFRGAAVALDYLHSEHVQHRDIKPENILILKKYPKVADFGLARVLESQRLVSATSSGTPAYMAPEVWRGKVSPHSDQYSLAATYAELRLGRSLITSRDMFEVMLSVVERTPNLDPLPAAEQAVVLKALAKEPDQRYGSCMEFVDALEAALAAELRRTHPSLAAADLSQTPPPGRPYSGVDTALATLVPGQTVAPLQPTNLNQPGVSQTAPMTPGVPDKAWQTTAPPTKRSPWLVMAFLITLLAIGGVLAWLLMPKKPFELDRASLTLKAGEARNITIPVKRHSYQGPITLTFEDVPANVEISEPTIDESKDAAEVAVRALPDAGTGQHAIKVVASSADRSFQASSTLDLNVPSLAYSMPNDWKKAADAEVVTDAMGHILYTKIDVVRVGIPVRFILVPDKGGQDDRRTKDTFPVPTFYIMEHKVTVDLFKAFATDYANQGKKLKGKTWEGLEINKNDRYPVMGVHVDDAHAFAVWVGGLLPLVEQWDKSCGSYVKGGKAAGPFKGTEKLGLNRGAEPLPIDETTDDVSEPYGVRDMASNGREWTRELDRDDLKRRVPVEQPEGTSVVLRGWSFRPRIPLRYAQLEEWQTNPSSPDARPYSGTESASEKDPGDIGFRVVIEPVRLHQ